MKNVCNIKVDWNFIPAENKRDYWKNECVINKRTIELLKAIKSIFCRKPNKKYLQN